MNLRQMSCFALLTGVALLSVSCGEDTKAAGEGTGATCDPSITYEADIKPFMQSYCLSCHSATKVDAQRNGAPSDHNFDTQAAILHELEHIEEEAAGGPNAIYRDMPPPGLPAPDDAARKKLGAWIACQSEED
jgi:uncharacterized membrane protein